jgi:hypothetical protein
MAAPPTTEQPAMLRAPRMRATHGLDLEVCRSGAVGGGERWAEMYLVHVGVGAGRRLHDPGERERKLGCGKVWPNRVDHQSSASGANAKKGDVPSSFTNPQPHFGRMGSPIPSGQRRSWSWLLAKSHISGEHSILNGWASMRDCGGSGGHGTTGREGIL